MSLLGALDSRTFIQRFWQKEPLLVRHALGAVCGLVDGDTLAGLACEEQVESRLVITRAPDDWACEHGPFEEARFAGLPATGWTLLVQAVDEWIPEVAALLSHFKFLPRWRMDDVMVSFATDGGGVGPHFDHYDVFLLQVEGTRRWQVGQRCDAHSPLRDHPDLKLLEAFEPREDWRLEPGDMLYLPPGVAHWGTAAGGDCITCSIGFRAPSHGEIIQAAMEQVLSRFGEQPRYVDVPGAVDPDPFRINDAALQRVRSVWRGGVDESLTDALAMAFGCLVTEPRNPALIEPSASSEVDVICRSVAGDGALEFAHHASSRFAYQTRGGDAVLFVDGEIHSASTSVARGICHGRLERSDLASDGALSLLARLFQQGSLVLLPPD